MRIGIPCHVITYKKSPLNYVNFFYRMKYISTKYHLRCAKVDLLVVWRPCAAGDHLLRVGGRQQRRPVPLSSDRTHKNKTVLKKTWNLPIKLCVLIQC